MTLLDPDNRPFRYTCLICQRILGHVSIETVLRNAFANFPERQCI